MNRLQTISQKHFVSTMLEMLELWKETFPNCEKTSKYLIYFTGVVIGNKEREKNAIEKWHLNMSKPINPKRAKYAKPVERILGEAPSCYLACQYKDIDALFGSVNIEGMSDLNIVEKYKSDVFSTSDRSLFWKFMQTLNQNALSFIEKDMQRLPSREEIQENIRKHKQTKEIQTGPPSMVKAFHSSFIQFSEIICNTKTEKENAFRKYVSKTDPNELLSKWTDMLTNNSDFCKKCNEADVEWLTEHASWEAVPIEFHPLIKAGIGDPEKSTQLCKLLEQMSSFSSVRKHIPTGMMGQIESYALRLAEDINNGKCDLNNINLQQIGQDVLQNCDSNEMMAMADNIQDLIPTLQNLRTTMSSE